MKTNKIISLMVAVAVMMTFAVSAWAIGTSAGTILSNTATVTFQNAAGIAQAPVVSNTVTTTVLQVAAVTVTTTQPTINVAPGQTNVANYFTITNNGNYADQFEIVPLTNASVTNIRYYVNSVANATLTTFDGIGTGAVALTASGTSFLTPNINSTPASTSVPVGTYPNGTTIFVVVDIPTNAPAGLLAGGGKVQNIGTVKSVFSKNTVTNATSATMVDNVQVGALTVAKTVQNITAAGAVGTTATGKPGETLEYVITVTNTGTGIANNVILADPVDVNTTYIVGSDVFGGAAVGTSQVATAAPAGVATAANRIYTLGTGATNSAGGSIAAGGIVTVTFRVTIN